MKKTTNQDATVRPAVDAEHIQEILDQAAMEPTLLGWVETDPSNAIQALAEISEDDVLEIWNATQANLAARVSRACDQQIAPLITTDAGLAALCVFAALLYQDAEHLDATDAMELVMDAIRRLVHDRGGRLNSLEVIGTRVAYAVYEGQQRIVAGGLKIFPDDELPDQS